ncbi:hypothetical protein BGZ88_005537, partial [Linnemannia elongata]
VLPETVLLDRHTAFSRSLWSTGRRIWRIAVLLGHGNLFSSSSRSAQAGATTATTADRTGCGGF